MLVTRKTLKWWGSVVCFQTFCVLISSPLVPTFRDWTYQAICAKTLQTSRFYTCYVQCVSSLLLLFITWPPLWLWVDGADWQLILSGLTFIPLSCVSPGALFPRKKNREDFHIVQLTYFSLCISSMGATPKSGWMLQVSQERVMNLTELGCH